MFCYSSLPRYKSSQDYHKMYKRILHIGDIQIHMRNGEKKDEIKKQTGIRCNHVFYDLANVYPFWNKSDMRQQSL